jgi:predicted amidophosphoribosyltransferase
MARVCDVVLPRICSHCGKTIFPTAQLCAECGSMAVPTELKPKPPLPHWIITRR